MVKCSQTSKLHSVRLKELSREDMAPVTNKYLTKGAKLMLAWKGKEYPVQFMHYKGNTTCILSNKVLCLVVQSYVFILKFEMLYIINCISL